MLKRVTDSDGDTYMAGAATCGNCCPNIGSGNWYRNFCNTLKYGSSTVAETFPVAQALKPVFHAFTAFMVAVV